MANMARNKRTTPIKDQAGKNGLQTQAAKQVPCTWNARKPSCQKFPSTTDKIMATLGLTKVIPANRVQAKCESNFRAAHPEENIIEAMAFLVTNTTPHELHDMQTLCKNVKRNLVEQIKENFDPRFNVDNEHLT